MGLLGDADSQANFALAAGLLGGGNFGQAFGRGLAGYQATLHQDADRKMQEAYRRAQMLQIQQQLEERQAAQAQAAAQRQFLQSLPSPAQGALSGGGGPTPQNAARIDPNLQSLYEGVRAGVIPYATYLAATQKDNTPKVLKSGEKVFSPDYSREIASNTPPPDLPTAIREYNFSVGQGYRGSFDEWSKAQKQAGATRISPITNVNAYMPASEAAQRQFMEKVATRHDALQTAPVVLQNIEAAKKLIPGASKFMGPGGESILEASKFLNNRLGLGIDVNGVKDAEELRTRLFTQIMDNLKKMDASPSQMQQVMMRDSLGNLGTDPAALPRVLDVMGQIVRTKVTLHNTEVQDAEKRGVKFPFDPVIPLSTLAQPAPMPTADPRAAADAIIRGR